MLRGSVINKVNLENLLSTRTGRASREDYPKGLERLTLFCADLSRFCCGFTDETWACILVIFGSELKL